MIEWLYHVGPTVIGRAKAFRITRADAIPVMRVRRSMTATEFMSPRTP